MPRNPLARRLPTLFIAMFALGLALATAAIGENIQVGGGQPLDLSTLAVVHQETFETGQSPDTVFWGLLDVGQKENDPWTGLLANGAYALLHKGRSGDVRYYFRHYLDQAGKDPLAQYALSVDIAGKFTGELSGAGLLYAYDPQTKGYLAFVKGAGRAYTIYKRDEQGLRRITGGESEAVKAGQANRLAIVPRSSDIDFYINGTHVAALKNEAATAGGAGLLAISSGMFAFDNFTLYRTPQPPAELTLDPAEQTQTLPQAGQITLRTDEPTTAQAPVVQTAPESQKKMLQSYEEVLEVGMDKKQVVQLFGNPAYERGSRLFYELDKQDPGKAVQTLVIQFDENDKIIRFQLL